MNNRPIYLSPTYHPAAEKLIEILSEEFEIVFYNKDANKGTAKGHMVMILSILSLQKITLKRFDFALTNTFPLVPYIIKKRPMYVVTEDYLFCLPYLLLCKMLRIRNLLLQQQYITTIDTC